MQIWNLRVSLITPITLLKRTDEREMARETNKSATMQQWDSVIDDNGIGVGYGENDIGVEHFDITKFVDEL